MIELPPRLPWMAKAACRGTDVHYAERNDSATLAEARALCADCPVRAACGQLALETREPWGIWGGMTPGERRRLLKLAA